MAQIDRVANYLAKNNTGRGVTASRVASDTKVPRDSVMKRIYDLRQEGYTIYSNVRTVQGKRKTFYRFAD